MPVFFLTTTALACAAFSLFFGVLLGWYGLFTVTVWAVVALFPTLVLDWVALVCGLTAKRCPVQ